jgi:hypothetical protein
VWNPATRWFYVSTVPRDWDWRRMRDGVPGEQVRSANWREARKPIVAVFKAQWAKANPRPKKNEKFYDYGCAEDGALYLADYSSRSGVKDGKCEWISRFTMILVLIPFQVPVGTLVGVYAGWNGDKEKGQIATPCQRKCAPLLDKMRVKYNTGKKPAPCPPEDSLDGMEQSGPARPVAGPSNPQRPAARAALTEPEQLGSHSSHAEIIEKEGSSEIEPLMQALSLH